MTEYKLTSKERELVKECTLLTKELTYNGATPHEISNAFSNWGREKTEASQKALAKYHRLPCQAVLAEMVLMDLLEIDDGVLGIEDLL